MSKLADAQHEAAHIVVGVALGLRLRTAHIRTHRVGRFVYTGETVWDPAPWPREAGLIMSAAGLAWERACGDLKTARSDTAELRRAGVRGNARVRVLERAAWSILEGRVALHTRLTRALLDGPVTWADIRAMIRGPAL